MGRDVVGIGVIGVGLMGRRHAENARRVPGARLVAVCDAARDVAARVAADLGADAAASVEEVVGRDDVGAVVVASPSPRHAEHAVAALAAGKDVLLEKPMALTLADCDRVIRAAADSGARLQIGFMRRYDPPYADAHRLIRSGALGAPLLYSGSSRGRAARPRRLWSPARPSRPSSSLAARSLTSRRIAARATPTTSAARSSASGGR